jgi:hypothetical protein
MDRGLVVLGLLDHRRFQKQTDQVQHRSIRNPHVQTGLSSDNYFSRSATIRIPDRPRTEQGADDNYFSRSGRQSGLPSGPVFGYALRAG